MCRVARHVAGHAICLSRKHRVVSCVTAGPHVQPAMAEKWDAHAGNPQVYGGEPVSKLKAGKHVSS